MIVCAWANINRELKTSATKPADCFERQQPKPYSPIQSPLSKEIISDWTSLTVICFGVCFVKMSSFPLMCNARHTRDHFTVMTKKEDESTAARKDVVVLPTVDEKIVPFQYTEQKPMESISHLTLLNTSVDQWRATKLFLQNTAEQLVHSVSKFTPGNHH
ncbi:hypothetical protein QR680_019195 [Steinernema hermaphroditum]|uniref:Uncharacterized protein n=1 Tax=Steinernema hermaphroditum TaxID=289476 RepID=A0AA39LRH2_9BILA|nr:hypothetical protein QR680_019195 [Steinernema hermaphroditum]